MCNANVFKGDVTLPHPLVMHTHICAIGGVVPLLHPSSAHLCSAKAYSALMNTRNIPKQKGRVQIILAMQPYPVRLQQKNLTVNGRWLLSLCAAGPAVLPPPPIGARLIVANSSVLTDNRCGIGSRFQLVNNGAFERIKVIDDLGGLCW